MPHYTTEDSGMKALTDSHRQPNGDLAELAEHWSDDMEVLGSNPTGGNFEEIYFVLCNFRSVR